MTAGRKQRAHSSRKRAQRLLVLIWLIPAVLLPALTPAQPAKIHRIGFLITSSPSAMAPRLEAFRHGLRELGYAEGKDIVIEQWYGDGRSDHLAVLAAELANLKVDVLVTSGPTATRPAQQATSTIPIVMTFDDDRWGAALWPASRALVGTLPDCRPLPRRLAENDWSFSK